MEFTRQLSQAELGTLTNSFGTFIPAETKGEAARRRIKNTNPSSINAVPALRALVKDLLDHLDLEYSNQ